MQQKDIAKALGKSKGYVSQYATLLDLPDAIAQAFKTERTTDVTLIYELVNCHKKDAAATESWLGSQEVSRGALKQLKEFIDARQSDSRHAPAPVARAERHHPDPDKKTPAHTLRKPVIAVECDRKPGVLLFAKRPTKKGLVWVQIGTKEKEVKAETIKVLSIAEK